MKNFIPQPPLTISDDVKCEVSDLLTHVWIGHTWFRLDEAHQLRDWLTTVLPNEHGSYTDIVSRLRARYGSRDHQHLTWASLLDEAADEIERLRRPPADLAAAPDLLEALQCLLPGLVLDLRYADDDDDKDALRSRIETVEAAIAKATA